MGQTTDRGPGERVPRRLVLVRHAEAVPSSGTGDHGRRLTPRGLGAARAVGAWLAAAGICPDLVVHSPAARTTQTWVAMTRGGLTARAARPDRTLYDAGVDDLLETIRLIDPGAATLLLVGHAPAVPRLAAAVGASGRGVDGDAFGIGWPPGAAAIIEHDGAWVGFPAADTGVVAFHVP